MEEPGSDPVKWIAQLQWHATQSGKLSMWTVYDHPTDYPTEFVARQFLTDGDGARPTANAFRANRLESMRMILRHAGLTCLMRDHSDDKKIIETWL